MTAITLNDLTMGEVAQIEDLTGLSITAIGDEKTPKARFLTALAYLAKRRENPAFTYSEAEALTLREVNELTSGGDVDPEGERA